MQLKPDAVSQVMLELIRSDDINNTPQYVIPGFKVDNIYPIFEKYFAPVARQAFATKANGLVHQYREPNGHAALWFLMSQLGIKKADADLKSGAVGWKMVCDRVNYFAIRCERSDIHKAVEKLVLSINTMASMGFLRASMLELGVVKFDHVPGQADEVAVISYLTLTDSGEHWVAANIPKLSVKEGAIPSRLEEI